MPLDFKGPFGRANPYGVYDVGANRGWVRVRRTHDIAAFAGKTVRSWWESTGRNTYPSARRLLITADGGGSNDYRTRAWKIELAIVRCRDRTAGHGLPSAGRDEQMEQDRAPTLRPHHDALERPAVARPRGHPVLERCDQYQHRSTRRSRPRHRDRGIFRDTYAILFPHLADRQIRLVLGADANSMTEQGREGTGIVARAAGIDPKIVTTGIAELEAAHHSN